MPGTEAGAGAERSKVENALRLQREHFRALVENSLDIITILDLDFHYLYYSPSTRKMLGYGESDLLGKSPADYIHPDDFHAAGGTFSRLLRKPGDEATAEFRFRCKDGSWRALESRAKVVDGGPGEAPFIVVNSRDISRQKAMQEDLQRHREHLEELVVERTRELESSNERLKREIAFRAGMEEELRRSEAGYRLLAQNVADVIWTTDLKLRFTYVSPSVERVTGFTEEEAAAGTVEKRLAPHSKRVVWDMVVETMERYRAGELDLDTVWTLEVEQYRKDGSTAWAELTVRLLKDEAGRPSGLLGVSRDVTERRQARRRLERLNRLFLSLGSDFFENMEKVVEACRDMLGGTFAAYCRMEKGRLHILSTAAGLEGFIVARDPRGYAPCRIISGEEEGPLLVADLAEGGHGGADSLAESFGFRSLLACPVRLGEDVMGCICYYDTEPRAYSHEDVEIMGMLARAIAVEEERLEQEQSLKDFVDVASHELRHPITLMKGYALTLSRHGDRLDEKMRREYLDVISQGADRMGMLIRKLLDTARIERGRFALQRKAQPLEPLLRQAVREMADKGCVHDIAADFPAALRPREVDAEKLMRVLVILLDNAAAHSPAGSEVAVAAVERGGEAVLSVSDRGTGVPEKDRELIFERFYQVEEALHHTTRGMGLGLYIAREIVEAHGGRIWHEHNPGGGSVFRFTLP